MPGSTPRLEARAAAAHRGTGVFALEDIPVGVTILRFVGPVEPVQHHYTIQVGPGAFMGRSGGTDDFVNHSCDPNGEFGAGLILVARRRIAAGEEITYDYCSGDWDLAEFAFTCHCAATRCRGRVRGYAHLSASERAAVPSPLPHLLAAAAAQAAGHHGE